MYCMRGRALSVLAAITILAVVAGLEATPKLDFDPYEALGVARSAKRSQIRRAFRTLSLKYHPDKNVGNPSAAEKFKQVSDAYEVLGDSDKRAIFDQFGQEEYHSKWEFLQKTGGNAGTGGDFYGPDTNVKPVTSHNFTSHRDKPMLVEFYAPWCIHCQQMTSAWRKAALLLDDLVTGYPSVFLYPAGHPNQSPEPFESHHHSADEIVSFVKQIVRPSTKAIEEWNFERTVLESTRPWLVVFKTPWCGPCKQILPTLRRFAATLEDVVSVGIVDCEQSPQLCHDQQVQYYPALKLFPRYDKREYNDGQGQPIAYNGRMSPAALALGILENVLNALLVHDGQSAEGSCGTVRQPPGDDMDDHDFYAELDLEDDM